jgi:hypothetical protein
MQQDFKIILSFLMKYTYVVINALNNKKIRFEKNLKIAQIIMPKKYPRSTTLHTVTFSKRTKREKHNSFPLKNQHRFTVSKSLLWPADPHYRSALNHGI